MNDHVLGCWAKLCECEETHYHSYKCSYGCICPSLRAYGEKVAEEMRAACIKAVAPWCNCTAPTTTSGEHDDWCLSVDLGNSIREVQP
jgi:hypothetical protein